MHQKEVNFVFCFSRSEGKKGVLSWRSPYISAIAFLVPVLIFPLLGGCGSPESGSNLQGHLLIVGGSTVQPFTQAAALLF